MSRLSFFKNLAESRLFPVRVYLTVLGVVYLAEVAVMFILPVMMSTTGRYGWTEAIADPTLLTLIIAPVLSLVLINPLRRIAEFERAKANSIIATAADGIITTDGQHTILSCNQAARTILGLSGERGDLSLPKLLPGLFGEGVGGERSDSGRETKGSPLEELATQRSVETTITRADGQAVPLAISVSQTKIAGDRIFTLILRDLSERLEMEMQRRERDMLRADQLGAVAQVAGGIAHELRNPLTSIKMLMQASLESGSQAGLSADDRGVIIEEIRRMEGRLNTFLDLTRPTQSRRGPIDLCHVLDRVVALIQGRAGRQHVTVEVTRGRGPVRLIADAEQIQQVILNLALNGLDAMPRGGRLTFDIIAGEGSPVEIHVSDTGSGIEPTAEARLFEAFVTTKETGLGLGLVLSRRIAQSHGGSLEAFNRPEGGACFVLRLPVAGAEEQQPLQDQVPALGESKEAPPCP